MSYDTILVSGSGPVQIVTFNRPEKLNAMSDEFIADMNAYLDSLDRDTQTRVIILTGGGRAFIAGADVSLMVNMTPLEAADYSHRTTEMYRKMETSGKIFIAAINGYAFGGGLEMSLACDLRIASKKAKFGLTEVSLGIFPGGGGTQRLPRLLGMAKAKELILTGRVFGAQEALEMGLVSRLTEPEELLQASSDLAEQILKNGKVAVALAKQSMNCGMQMDMASAMNQEKNLFALCFGTQEQVSRMTGFLEK